MGFQLLISSMWAAALSCNSICIHWTSGGLTRSGTTVLVLPGNCSLSLQLEMIIHLYLRNLSSRLGICLLRRALSSRSSRLWLDVPLRGYLVEEMCGGNTALKVGGQWRGALRVLGRSRWLAWLWRSLWSLWILLLPLCWRIRLRSRRCGMVGIRQ